MSKNRRRESRSGGRAKQTSVGSGKRKGTAALTGAGAGSPRSRDASDDPSRIEEAGRGEALHGQNCKGLCINCANRDTCLLPRAEGGVWHCEEYLEER